MLLTFPVLDSTTTTLHRKCISRALALCAALFYRVSNAVGSVVSSDKTSKPTATLQMSNAKYYVLAFCVLVAFGQISVIAAPRKTMTPQSSTESLSANLRSAEECNNQAFAAFQNGDYNTAIALFRRALTFDRKAKNREGEGITLSNLGRVCETLGQHDKALQCFQQALVIARELKKQDDEGATLGDLGSVYEALGQYDKALVFHQKALILKRATKNRAGEGITLNNIGIVYEDLGQYTKALDFYQKSLAIKRETGNKDGEGTALNNIGSIYEVLGRYSQAIECFQQALDIVRASKIRDGESILLGNLGLVHYDLSQYDKALGFYRQALDIARATQDRDGESTALSSIGSIYESLNQPDKALDFYQKALLITRERKNRTDEGIALSNIGSVYAALGRHKQALGLYQRALVIARETSHRAGEGVTLGNIGLSYKSLGEYDKALNFYQQALVIARETKDRNGEGIILNNLLMISAVTKKPALAIFYGKQSVNIYQAVRTDIKTLDKETQRRFLASKQNTYRKLADLLIEAGRLPEAQQVLGFLKQQELKEFVRGDNSGTSSAFNAQEAAWQKRYNEIAERLTQIGVEYGQWDARKPANEAEKTQRKQHLATLRLDLDVAQKAFDTFFKQIETEFSNRGQISNRVLDLPETRALQSTLGELGNGSVILYTIVGPDDFHVIVMTANTIKAEKNDKPVPATVLRSKVNSFLTALKNPNFDPRPAGKELYDILFCGGKVARDLEGANAQTLMWSLDDVLRYVPMSALSPDGSGYLTEKYSSIIFTLASYANLTAQPQASWTALGAGVSKSVDGFDSLPGALDELNSVVRENGNSASRGIVPGTIQSNALFNLDALNDALTDHPQVVHIASHFSFRPGDETASFLLLGDGTHLTVEQIKRLDFKGVDLLTLSACDTASGGANANGREVESFGALAQQGGARAIIASLWPVADSSTPLLMKLFYQSHQNGANKAQSLREAQLSLLRGTVTNEASDITRNSTMRRIGGSTTGFPPFVPDPKAPYAHPYYWAPFILIGNWR